MPRRRRKGIVEAYHPGYIFTITKREALGYISLSIVLRNNIVFDRCGNVMSRDATNWRKRGRSVLGLDLVDEGRK